MSNDVHVELSDDFNYLGEILREPGMREAVTEDGAEELLSKIPNMAAFNVPGSRLLKVVCLDHPSGAFYLMPVAERVWEIHTLLTHGCRGLMALAAGRLGLRHMFEVEQAIRLISRCPDGNRKSLLYARMLGFRVTSIERDWHKNGLLLNSVHVELSAQEWRFKCHS